MRGKVNPNRMMLLRLRRRLELARRGHKLLKNKQEKLMQSFIGIVRETIKLRSEVEEAFLDIGGHYIRGRAMTDRQSLVDALDVTTKAGELTIDMRYEMNIQIPELTFTIPEKDPPYKLTSTSPELDYAFERLFKHFPDLLRLAEKENALYLMSDELEKTRRRVNALEYVLIPDLEETIRSIESKLSENERSTQTRLMKVKEIVQRRSSS